MSKERVEDLGKLSILLEEMVEEEIFDLIGNMRCKDYADYFDTLSAEEQHNIAHQLAYNLDELKNKVYKCLAIADGRYDEERCQ